MIRVAIIDGSGTTVPPNTLATAAELREAIAQAQRLIMECDRCVLLKEPKAPAKHPGTPYLS